MGNRSRVLRFVVLPLTALGVALFLPAAEWFISYLFRMDNVVLIGHPTRGAMNLLGAVPTLLPHSMLPITLPTAIMVEQDLIVREGRGHLPDLWISSADALDAAVRFLQRYVADE